MAMDIVLKKLEERIETMVEAHAAARKRGDDLQARVAELEEQVRELEGRLEEGAGASARLAELESQRGELADRLEKVVLVIDRALETTSS
jgi:uncharacterized protein YceH (UPF0502 family)